VLVRERMSKTPVRPIIGAPGAQRGISRITTRIARLGGNILALGISGGDDPATAIVTVKVDAVPADALLAAMQDLYLDVLDMRVAQGNRSEEHYGRSRV
jgi:hypothetical protein